ncbi:MAG: RagB/SusD family nutrient uptake outer membrane protein [Bacteroidales bacterium]
MTKNIKSYIKYTCLAAGVLFTASCEDFLDRSPLDQVTPQQFFNSDSDLAAYTINRYNFSTHSGFNLGVFALDNNTDNQMTTSASVSRWVPDEWRVGEKDGSWSFGNIRQANYFFEQVLPKVQAGKISGTATNINQYIGEMYFIRAWEYFQKLQVLGDFPILKKTLPDNLDILVEASKRRPRNEVARFILQDLDSAAMLMGNKPVGGKNRLTRNAALLLKSRVALYEGSWLTYHKGTAFVPGGPGWPGAKMDYLKDFKIDIDSEINYFLDECMKASEEVSKEFTLTESTKLTNPGPQTSFNKWNPYFDMFNASNMEDISEVLFWKAYSGAQNVTHGVSNQMLSGGGNSGLSRSLVDSYLMENGLPIYATGSGYHGEDSIETVKADRDIRLQLFVSAPSDIRTWRSGVVEPFKKIAPAILEKEENRCVSGYQLRKGMTYDPTQDVLGSTQTYGCIVFRGAEAYLNYMEADYIKDGALDANSQEFWRRLRQRAQIDTDFNKTIAATDLNKENDWAVYSAGQQVDATLYNIRRERRNEFVAEGMRWADLKRWRALDQVANYQMEGFNLWGGKMQDHFTDNTGKNLLIPTGTPGKTANVSSQAISGDYLRPYQIITTNNMLYNGYTWRNCKYLEPIAQSHFNITTSVPGNLEGSVIYQNPGWPYQANQSGTDVK